MPFAVRKQGCTKADGTRGSHVVINTDTNKQVSCHLIKDDANTAMRIRASKSKDK